MGVEGDQEEGNGEKVWLWEMLWCIGGDGLYAYTINLYLVCGVPYLAWCTTKHALKQNVVYIHRQYVREESYGGPKVGFEQLIIEYEWCWKNNLKAQDADRT